MSSKARNFFLSGILILSSPSVYAWGDLGHQTIGAIAESYLTNKGKHFVYDILGTEPLAVAAIFADQVRDEPFFRNEFNQYHFIEIPAGFTFNTLPPYRRELKDADTILRAVPKILLESKLNVHQKALLFRYYVHLVGDVHQPLHVGNGTDRGANLCDVAISVGPNQSPKEVPLHSAWDTNLVKMLEDEYRNPPGSTKPRRGWFGYYQLKDLILAQFEKAKALKVLPSDQYVQALESIRSAPLSSWYDESQKLHKYVYPMDKGTTNPPGGQLPYCRIVNQQTKKTEDGIYDQKKIPLLDAQYIAQALPIIKQRLFLAGIRLAHVINDLAEKSNTPEWTDEIAKQQLEPIILRN